jgi:hypothetical protein
LRHAPTAILREKSHELGHTSEVYRVVDELLFLSRGNERSTTKLFQMEGQRRPRNIQLFTDTTGRHSLGSCLNQQTIDREPRFLGERGERSDSRFYFHISTIIEIRVSARPSISYCIVFISLHAFAAANPSSRIKSTLPAFIDI